MLLETELKILQYEESERTFFEARFEYGDDEATISGNLKVANSTYKEKNKIASEFAQKIEDGEVTDNTELALAIQELVFSYKALKSFEI